MNKAIPIPLTYGKDDFLLNSEDIAPAYAFMASDAAKAINGINLFVDGGTDAITRTERFYGGRK